MSKLKTFLAAGACALVTLPAFADSKIMVQDAYARAAGMSAKAGAAFMQIMNQGDEDDQLIDARSDISKRVELHTHKIDDQGVAKMMHVPEGFTIPAGGMHALQRGGDHVMFMGLNGAMEQGDTVTVTLVFEKAGELVVEIPVDLNRDQMGGGMMKMDHSNMGQNNMGQGQMGTMGGGANAGASN
ncbi:copper chaperone PCu(A)C [Aliiroseovarius crassostreae]|uniref:copper chaperone PCu(A)C n=1 Tax=Aliiroseovarius crassostreae TaxID=154981 RepID=UPI002204442C|nr:copper chaperone PCu(A)C [Aliiroseovarius crassostreae]UWQ07353.1 copper chaperone PCu(A)C [Aliiroseovarius crassostreae]UWQ10462.1 copper chaperone PCu(A)C [Aliiroseovarius crassostreae]